jgi:hypothetical protein
MPTLRLPGAPARQDKGIRRKPSPVATPPVAQQPLVPPPSSSVESGHKVTPLHRAEAAPPESARRPGIDRHPAPHVAPFGRVSPDGQEQRSAVSGQPSAVSLRAADSPVDVAPPPLRLVGPQSADQQPTPAPDGAIKAVSSQRSTVSGQRPSLIAQPLLRVPQPRAAAARRSPPSAGAVVPDIDGRRSAGQSPISRCAEGRRGSVPGDHPLPSIKPPAPEPTVHVTIGRIEVRAIQPEPARPGPSRARAPRLSLADYLKQEGERRQ